MRDHRSGKVRGLDRRCIALPDGMILPHAVARNVILDLGGCSQYLTCAGSFEKWQDPVLEKKDGTAADTKHWKALVLSSSENTSAHQIE